ncbi:hypothetical protein GCM10011348_38330 [Marinobacterium nitratireducens]|uniref:Universal stress protein n=1 Tax=Marinobacterium nitratireducens TaxID=518897 RepID=A0A917ZNH9_9GAMM|nr:hypothetical protein [Marinobacterium nitratireducens]GGO86750.1 hypothetical protein GCM10011348_38330 [Marinobacterium nitratireducens]
MKRLVLTLTPGRVDFARLDPFLRLAAELGVELEALLIEDQDLRTVAGLPFCHEVIRDSARARPLNQDSLEQATRELSRALQQHLQRLTLRHPLQWQLRVHRGHWFDGFGESWSQTELLLLSGPARAPAGARNQTRAVALLCAGNSGSAARALQLAARLAAAQRQPLLVLALPDCPYRRAADLPPLPRSYQGTGAQRIERLANADPALLRGWLPGLADTLVVPQEWIWPDGRPANDPLLELPGIQTLLVR